MGPKFPRRGLAQIPEKASRKTIGKGNNYIPRAWQTSEQGKVVNNIRRIP